MKFKLSNIYIYKLLRNFLSSHSPYNISSHIRSFHRIRIIGTTSTFLLGLLLLTIIVPLYNITGVEDTVATVTPCSNSGDSNMGTNCSLTFTTTRATASANLNVSNTNGAFAKSTDGSNGTTDTRAKFALSTNNTAGYELKIKSSATGTNATKLVNTNDDTKALSSISTKGIEEGSFTNNTWGYLPNYYNSTANTTKYYPITTSDVTLRKTTTNNTGTNTDSYTIGIGVKADISQESGAYRNTNMLLTYIANPVNYTIVYDKNAGDTVSNMPYSSNSNTQSGSVSATSIDLSNSIPTRTGYIFAGWCSVATAKGTGVMNSSDTCSGTIYNPEGNGTNIKYAIDRTSSSNSATLYAMWTANPYTITLNKNGGTNTPTASITARYMSNTLPVITTLPQRKYTASGFTADGTNASSAIVNGGTAPSNITTTHTFNGWYSSTTAATAVLVASKAATPALQASAKDTALDITYTDSSKRWIRTSNTTLYAKWSSGSTVTFPTITKTGYNCGWSKTKTATTYTYESGKTGVTLTNDTKGTYYGICVIKSDLKLVVTGNDHLSSMTLKTGSTSGTEVTGTKSGNTITFSGLTYGTKYYLYPTFNTGYSFSKWAKTDSATNASLNSTTTMNTYYQIGDGDGAVTLTAKGNTYTATFYYNDKTSSGTVGADPVIATTTASCTVSNTAGDCTATIPNAVKNSVGQYNNAYVGVATATATMSSSTTVTLSSNADRYAVYRTKVTLYKPKTATTAETVTLYRNQWFTSKAALSSTILTTSTTGKSNYSYAASLPAVTGTSSYSYGLYGFNTATNTTSRLATCAANGATACSTIARLATSSITTAYAIDRVGIPATFYYNNNTTADSCTTASVTSVSGTGYRYAYTTSTSAATTKNGNVTIPTDVTNSKGTCGMSYKNVGTATNNMTAVTPTAATVDGVYYARYGNAITNYYYNSSSYTSRTLYRNQRVTGTATSNVSAIVLSTSATGTSNYSTAVGPGSSAWAGLATTSTNTVAYNTVAKAATATTVYDKLYTIYQFNVTYSKGTNTSSIGSTSGSCKVHATSASAGGTSCTVTLPTISPATGYEAVGWDTTKDASTGTSAGSSYTISINPTTLYGNVKQSCVSTLSGYMQEAPLASETCDGASGTMTDRRDSSTYTVKKIADNLWMTQNLRITGYISGAESNMNYSGTVNITQNNLSHSNYYYPNTYTNGTNVWYDFCAATAASVCGSDSGNYSGVDSCPANWRLPTKEDFNTILTYSTDFSPVTGGWNNKGYDVGVQTNYGFWWSSTAGVEYSTFYQWILQYNGSRNLLYVSNAMPDSYGGTRPPRSYGFFIRCIRKP